jgi:hypothetical protein
VADATLRAGIVKDLQNLAQPLEQTLTQHQESVAANKHQGRDYSVLSGPCAEHATFSMSGPSLPLARPRYIRWAMVFKRHASVLG